MTDSGSWLLVDFSCRTGLADIVAAELWARGVAGVEIIDAPQGMVTLRTSLGGESSDAVSDLIGLFPGLTATEVEIERSVADSWRDHVSPTHVIDDVWLVPAWCTKPDGRCILIEPFDTFGLGNHPTTVLALRAALAVPGRSARVLDLGSGSGVLAVAVAALTGRNVDAHDIAPQGEAALRHNGLLNDVANQLHWRGSLGEADEDTYELVIANILAPVLRDLARDIIRATSGGGHLVLSGIRSEQVDDVLSHYPQFTVESSETIDGWAGVLLRRM